MFLILLASCKVVEYKTVCQPIPESEYQKRPKRIILMIGDGMGLAHITAGMYANDGFTILEKFTTVGLQKCSSADALVTDSAAAATAMACGVKTFNNAVGVDIDTMPRTSILLEAGKNGYSTGIITTSSLVHATPAGFYANCSQRYQYEKIASDFVDSNIDIAIGGGKKYFDRRESDERNIYKELEQKGYDISDFLSQAFSSVAPKSDKPFIFFTADSEPLPASQGRNYLSRASRVSTKFLSQRSQKGSFLLVEGAQIDWSSHARNQQELLYELKDFEEAVQTLFAIAQADHETLLIVTADHECGGLTICPSSTKKKLQLEFASNAHTPQLVPVFAIGPGSAFFSGIYDNTEIYHKMRFLMNLD